MSDQRWQFWIDVGGTFTDCIARRPDKTLVRHKLLSSGVTKRACRSGSTNARIVFDARGEPEDFWRAYQLRLISREGQILDESRVRSSRAEGVIELETPLAVHLKEQQAFELFSSEPAPIVAIRHLMGLRLDESIPAVTVRLGTTRGTNALLTRSGAPTALITTKGFQDILLIGNQDRPRLFDLAIAKAPPLFTTTTEVSERITVDGEVLLAPDRHAIRRELNTLRQQGIESLAICFLHAYRFWQHEALIEEIAKEVGFREVSCSSRVAPLIKLVSRGDTTVVDAYLNPVLQDYVAELRSALGDESDLRILTSAGGLVSAGQFRGTDSILSGPAGGVVGFASAGQAAGFERSIGFDMGGTSTDVTRFDGEYELEFETEKAGVRIVAPMMAIETVAAGGGSVCWFDGVKLCVGPHSAGADPGPLCYGGGGPLTVTDVNLFLGKLLPQHFPFPLLPTSAIEEQLTSLCREVQNATGRPFSAVELADGFLQVANANMAKAIRSISIAKGYDPSDYVLVAFGGAAPQHACAIAQELGIQRILNHPDAGILSALGAGMADVIRHRAVGVYRAYSEEEVERLESTFVESTDAVKIEVQTELGPLDPGKNPAESSAPEDPVPNPFSKGDGTESRISVQRFLDLRFQGQEAFLTIERPDDGNYAASFLQEHRRLYGYVHEDRPLEIVAARVKAVGQSDMTLGASQCVKGKLPEKPSFSVQAYFHAVQHDTEVFFRNKLQPGHRIRGPAIVLEDVSTTVIDPGWETEVLSAGELLIQRAPKESPRVEDQVDNATLSVSPSPRVPSPPSPILLEIFNNHFAGIAEQMGITLRNTSSSVNVKERLDFSCALFTATGDLVVNAPHIPVHLGAMGETVKRVIADNPGMQAGDVFVTNDPYRGGSHLPDVTVVTPVHDGPSGKVRFFTASRAHHAEIGGITPGSMPPFSKNLAEEGVLIRNLKVIDGGHSRLAALRERLLSAPNPTRNADDNIADISAQIAANRQGTRDLLQLVARYSWPVVENYMQHIQQAAETKMRLALSRFPDGRHEFVDHLDDGSPIAVAVSVTGDSATIDFTGTGPVLPGNLNANRAIVTAAVMYCLRCLIDEDIPLNQGVLAPVEIVLPECLLNPPVRELPQECAAVAGGNVETSQRVVDVLLGAFGIAAASQGTMNNLLFGDETFGYYETICGGAGATRDADGASAVHTHMTNTRLTDPEVLEQRCPVRLCEFSIRRGSGGAGQHRGGDGVVRRIEFLKALEVSTVCQRRGDYAPYGLAGGEFGKTGRNTIQYRDGRQEELPAAAHRQVGSGDVLTIETPGGGGFGAFSSRNAYSAATGSAG